MPAAAVANLTPATGGMSGNCAGASGEVGVDKALSPRQARACLPQGRVRPAERNGQFWSVLLLDRFVEALDLGGLPQFGDELGLCLAREKGLDLTLHLFEFRGLLGALVLDLDDMPSELRLHRIGPLAGI